jgi:hypothetical protein
MSRPAGRQATVHPHLQRHRQELAEQLRRIDAAHQAAQRKLAAQHFIQLEQHRHRVDRVVRNATDVLAKVRSQEAGTPE